MLVEISSKPQILIRTTGIGCDSIQTPDLICINSSSLFIFLSQAYPPFRHCLLHAHTFKPECVPTWVVPSNMCKALIQNAPLLGLENARFVLILRMKLPWYSINVYICSLLQCALRGLSFQILEKKKKVCQ